MSTYVTWNLLSNFFIAQMSASEIHACKPWRGETRWSVIFGICIGYVGLGCTTDALCFFPCDTGCGDDKFWSECGS